MLPVIVLVGRPNVGKSTLFNRLTGTRAALVADIPGVTRDRLYGTLAIEEHQLVLIDTGGLQSSSLDLSPQVTEQAFEAIKVASLLLFIVDGNAGVVAEDLFLADQLRTSGKKIVVVLNKTEQLDPNLALLEFFSLGFADYIAISAEHGKGIDYLKERIILLLNDKQVCPPSVDSVASVANATEAILPANKEMTEPDQGNAPVRVAIVGRPNVGKSTFLNQVVGTARSITSPNPGTTRDTITAVASAGGLRFQWMDTAGMRRRAKIKEKLEKISVIKTLQAIESAEVVLFLFDAVEGVTEQDVTLISLILHQGKPIVIAANKSDQLNPSNRRELKGTLERRLHFLDSKSIEMISGLQGHGLKTLFKAIKQVSESGRKRWSTSQITQIVLKAQAEHPPPQISGRRIRLKYAHLVSNQPLTIAIHGNQLNALPKSYPRYLENYYRKALKLAGIPIRFTFKTAENPFAQQRNPLTPRQKQKRQRAIRYSKGSQ